MSHNYTVLHLHSDLSNGVTNIDSITKFGDYVDYAAQLGMKAIAFSEHGSVFEWVKKKETVEKAGLKYIHAEEFYVTSTLSEKIKDNKHVWIGAKNYDGVKELNALSSKAFGRNDNHYYYVPRISIDELINTSDNLVITTACLGGILADDSCDMKDVFLQFLINNKHRCYLEVQHHNVAEQIEYNKYLYKLHNMFGIPMVAATDTHALNEEHLLGRKILQKSKGIIFSNEENWDLAMKSYDELVDAFKKQNALPMDVVLEAIENTNKIADSVEEFTLNREYKYPHLWTDSEALFREKINIGIANRGVNKYPNYQEYLDRVEYEIEAYKHNNAIDFMLLMEDIIAWCRTQDVPIGYGRGSVNGSVIAWLLGITEMDSIKHKLNFERFMNIERISLSDIDTDFAPSRIEEVKNYIYNHEGLYCSDIITFNTIADKGAIRDVCRALYKPDTHNLPSKINEKMEEYSESARIYNGQGQSIGMDKELKEYLNNYMKITNDVCSLFDEDEFKARKDYEEVFKYVDLVKGTIVSIGTHPCGLVVSPITLDDNMGLCSTSTDPFVVSQIYMKEIDGLNYVKLDLLKLDTIELISNTCKLANIPMITPENIDINDDDVWKSMKDDTTGIFQWEGKSGGDYIKRLLSEDNIRKLGNVDRMTLLSIGNSAIRPAGASYRDDLASGVVRKSGSDAIDEFLKPTFGYLVFQCQIIEFLHEYCGFTMGEADSVRRMFAKKLGTDKAIPIIKDGGIINDKTNHYIPGFVETMKEKFSMPKQEAEETIVAFLKVIEDASDYLFSLNHSQPYSYEGYVCAWLRYYYPLEFLATALNINKDKEEKTTAYINYAKQIGVKILPIKFRHSGSEYVCDHNSNGIYKGIASIKYMNDTVAEQLLELGAKTYNNFVELLYDIKNTSINSRQLTILIQLNFFEEFGDINKLMYIYNLFSTIYDKVNISKEKGLVDDNIARQYCESETAKMFKFTKDGIKLMLVKVFETIEIEEVDINQTIKWQMEHLGYIDYVNDKLDAKCVLVTNLNTTNSPKFNAYCLKNGDTCTMKVAKKKSYNNKEIVTSFKDLPFENGDILYMKKCKRKCASKLVNGEWKEQKDVLEWWLYDYSLQRGKLK